MKSKKSQERSLIDLLQWNSVQRMSVSVDKLSRAMYVISIVLGLNLLFEVFYLLIRYTV